MLERYYKSTEDFIKNLDKNYDLVDFNNFLNKLIQPESDNQSKHKSKHYPRKKWS